MYMCNGSALVRIYYISTVTRGTCGLSEKDGSSKDLLFLNTTADSAQCVHDYSGGDSTGVGKDAVTIQSAL